MITIYTTIVSQLLKIPNKITFYLDDKYEFINAYPKDDTNAIILTTKKAIIRFFKKNYNIDKVREVYNLLKNKKCNNLEEVYETFELENYFVVVSKKISNNFKNNWKIIDKDFNYIKLEEDINSALVYLEDNHLCHRDTRIDNIGYDEDAKCFVLYDYGMISAYDYTNCPCRNQLRESIKFWKPS
jgi:serine/threonine protein kinase